MAIAIPAFSSFRDNAREARVKSSCHTVQLAVEAFSSSNDGIYPQNTATALANGDTVVDLLPSGQLMENAWTGLATEPRNGMPASPGDVGFAAIVNGALITGYTVTGFGGDGVVLTVGNGS